MTGAWTCSSAPLSLLSLACAAVPAPANDSSAELATGGLIFVHNDNVEMRTEDLAISAKQVAVRYRFFNKSTRSLQWEHDLFR